MVFCSISLPPLFIPGTINKKDLSLGVIFLIISAAGMLQLFLYVKSKEFFYYFLTCKIPRKQKLRHTEKVDSEQQAEKPSKFLIFLVVQFTSLPLSISFGTFCLDCTFYFSVVVMRNCKKSKLKAQIRMQWWYCSTADFWDNVLLDLNRLNFHKIFALFSSFFGFKFFLRCEHVFMTIWHDVNATTGWLRIKFLQKIRFLN